jgi:glycosyltransferase involved in cell wall biosynthesis
LSKWAGANPGRVIQFVLAGDGPLRNQLERGSVPPNLKLGFLGNVAYRDLPNLYAEAGIFVFPTLADTWGVVVNEALASGLPVLGSVRSQAVEELVEDGRNGWLFQPDKTEQMYNAIDRSLSTSVTTLNTMRRHARATALQLRPDYVADRVDAILAHMTRTS